MNALALLIASLALSRTVSFPTSDGGRVFADEYGSGLREVILVHGGRYNKESWAPQARALAAAGFHVLAIDFRDEHDVLAAAAYARKTGAKDVAVVGASLGATAAGDAAIEDNRHLIDSAVLLSETPNLPAANFHVPVLFIVARADANEEGPRLARIRAQYERVRAPKRLIVLPGSAHAQALFKAKEGPTVLATIIAFLKQN